MTRPALATILLTRGDGQPYCPAYTDIGGYPVLYLNTENDVFCATCATKNLWSPWGEIAEPGSYFVLYEGPAEVCAECQAILKSAYGDPAST